MGLIVMTMMTSCNENKTAATEAQQEEVKVYDPAKMLVRLSVIEVYPEYLEPASSCYSGWRVGEERAWRDLHLSISP